MKMNDKVHLLRSTKGARAYLVMGKEPVLIDTGFSWRGKRILKELASMGVHSHDIKHILLTHHDLDHIGNAAMLQELTGAQLWASAQDIPFITGDKHRPSFKRFLPYLFRVKRPRNMTAYRENERIGEIAVIPTPGHTPGHVCLLFENTLFAGDLVKSQKGHLSPYPSGWNWNHSLLLDSIRSLSQYSFEWVCPAHGDPVESSEIRIGQNPLTSSS